LFSQLIKLDVFMS